MRLIVCLSFAVGLLGCEQSATPAPKAASPAAIQAAAAAAELKAQEQRGREDKCRLDVADQRGQYKKLMAQARYWEASTAIRHCANVLSDKELLALVTEAEFQSHLKDVRNEKTPPLERVRLVEVLRQDFPEQAKKLDAMLTKIAAQAEAKGRSDVAEAKRKQGVRVGMSKDDVLASSWGRPETVNRTTTAQGTREQWVYGGRNYLYFEGDRLVSIQN